MIITLATKLVVNWLTLGIIVDIYSGDLNSSSHHESVMYRHIFAHNLFILALKYFQHHLKQTSSSVCEVGLGLC